MKKFIISILCVAVFFIGLGGLIQETGARFKSDEKALALIKQAQTAIGGEAAIQNVKSLTINGNVSKTFELEGTAKTEQGRLEINLQLPNQFTKSMKFGNPDNSVDGKNVELRKEVNVLLMRDGSEAPIFRESDLNGDKKVFILKKGEVGKVVQNDELTSTDAKRVRVERKIATDRQAFHRTAAGFHQNEFFRTTLALLMTTPQGTDVSFTYAGEGDVDGNSCDVVEAKAGESVVKLFLDKSSHLPRMISYQGFKPVVFKFNKDEMKNENETEARVLVNRLEKPEAAEIQVRFSDYRSVNGVLLPHQWSQTIAGKLDETFDVTGYDINPANIAEKFRVSPSRTFVLTERNPQ